MSDSDLPVYGGSLFAATKIARRDDPPLTADIDVDVCVVGGGYAGLAAAREIALRGWSVALLEARRIAWNASGRNTGFVLPGFAQSPDRVIARVGEERARALWNLAQEGLDYVRETIRTTNMPGVTPVAGWVGVSKTDDASEAKAEVAITKKFGVQAEFWDTARVRAQLKTQRYFHAVHLPQAFHVHPLNYAFGLAEAAAAAGVRIFEQTPALAIDAAGVRKRVITPRGRVRAGHAVLAGNVHLGQLMPSLTQTLLPITTYMVATAPLGDRLAAAIEFRGGVSDDWIDNHYRTTEDGRLIWLGRLTTSPANPRRYIRALRADIRRLYPQLGEVDIDYAWNGTGGSTVHLMPQIGEMSPGLWVASGFDGHGINTTAMAGTLIARGIVEGDRTWTLFAAYELVWAGGALGRGFARVGYRVAGLRTAIAGYLSRRRETMGLPAPGEGPESLWARVAAEAKQRAAIFLQPWKSRLAPWKTRAEECGRAARDAALRAKNVLAENTALLAAKSRSAWRRK